jgi:endonuclease-3
MNTAKRIEIFTRLRAANPHPTTELEYQTPFQLLIAVILSAQATDKSVNLATRKFFPEHGTPQGLLALGEERLADYIKTIGLYRTKAANVIKTCRMLVELHHGEVPEDREALEALPGVGRKTANVVLNTAFGHPTIAVDTHIFRVANRTGLARGKNVVAGCASLADSAWPLCLCRAQAQMPAMRPGRSLRIPRQDGVRPGRPCPGPDLGEALL